MVNPLSKTVDNKLFIYLNEFFNLPKDIHPDFV